MLFGKLIGQAQTNAYGEFSTLHPRFASVLYAADRLESKDTIEQWLSTGKCVVLDRYVSANQLHQAGKIHDPKEREEFLKWLDEMEHKILQIPRPDMVIYLDVPHHISIELMKKKEAGNKKDYSDGKIDKVEEDHNYQLNARESGIKMLQDNTWRRVDCSATDGALRSIEDIHEEILGHCLKLLS